MIMMYEDSSFHINKKIDILLIVITSLLFYYSELTKLM